MSKNTNIESNLMSEKNALAKEELKLFNSYNRHAKATVKLSILIELQSVINRIDVIDKIQNR